MVSTVRSKNVAAYSYIMQPRISLSGKVVGQILLCFKESNAGISDNIKNNLFETNTAVVKGNASGRLTTSSDEFWCDKTLILSIAYLS
jgi:hypothetical protein